MGLSFGVSSTTTDSAHEGRGFSPLAAIFFAAPAVSAAVPRLTPLLLGVLVLAALIEARAARLAFGTLLRPTSTLGFCLLFAAYLPINATWSLDRAVAFQKAGLATLIILGTFVIINTLAQLPEQRLSVVGRAFLAGAAIGAGFVLFELLTAQAITRFLFNATGFQPPDLKEIKMNGRLVAEIPANELNQNVALLTLNLWTALLLLYRRGGTAFRVLGMAGLVGATACAAAISRHETSQISLVVASVVLFASFRAPVLVNRTLMLCWVLAFALVVPAVSLAFQAGWHQASWLPRTAQARIILWSVTAEKLRQAPILGIGIRSTRVLDGIQNAHVEKPDGFVYARRTGRHAHNFYLQSWYELGAVGACLAAIAGAAVVFGLGRLPPETIPFANALFATFAILAAFAWDIWQTWLMAALGAAAASFAMACQGRRQPAGGDRLGS